MVFYRDLDTNSSERVIRIGWLNREQPFSQGFADPAFMDKLKLFYESRVRQSRGFHICPFCEARQFGISTEMSGKTLILGSAEIEVKDEQGRVFVAPDLLYHYITEHHYLPPKEFIEAVCKVSVE
jgi:hypothetical protein